MEGVLQPAPGDFLPIWNVTDWTIERRLLSFLTAVDDLAFGRSGDIFDLAGGAQQRAVGDGSLVRRFTAQSAIAVSPDGSKLLGDASANARVYRIVDGTVLQTLHHSSTVVGLAYSPVGTLVATGTADGKITFWNPDSGDLVRVLPARSFAQLYLRFSPNGELLVSAGRDGAIICVWRVSDGSLLRTLASESTSLKGLAISPDSQLLASSGDSSNVEIWRLSDGTLQHLLRGHVGPVSTVAFSSDGELLGSGGWDRTLRFWRTADWSNLRTYDQATGLGCISIAFSVDRSKFLYGTQDGTLVMARRHD